MPSLQPDSAATAKWLRSLSYTAYGSQVVGFVGTVVTFYLSRNLPSGALDPFFVFWIIIFVEGCLVTQIARGARLLAARVALIEAVVQKPSSAA